MTTWICFHCSFETSDHAEARAHFGDDSGDPALCLFWMSLDNAERAHEYQQVVLELNATREELLAANAAVDYESSEGMRMFRELESKMHQDLRRAEEEGYARGLRDAKKYPEELGLSFREFIAEVTKPSGRGSRMLSEDLPGSY